MEFRDHLAIIKKSSLFIIIFTVLVVAVSLVFLYFKAPVYQSSISFSVNRINRQETEYYEYDSFYAISASELFSQTLMSWFMTPSVLLEIYEDAGIDPQIKSLSGLAGRFKAKQYASQNIVVTFKEKTAEAASEISESVIKIVQDKSSQLNQSSSKESLFEVVGSTPVVVDQKPAYWLVALISFISGLVISFVLVYIFLYFRDTKPTQS